VTTLKAKLESELEILRERIDQEAAITKRKYQMHLAMMAERGADQPAIDAWLRSDAGKVEYEALKATVKRMVAGALARIADLGYFMELTNGS